MSAGNWQAIKDVVADALEVEPDVRADFLTFAVHERDLSSEDLEQVHTLLAAAECADARLPSSAFELLPGAAQTAALRPVDWTGRRIGNYRVVRFVARGGMGEVWEAVQDGTGRRAALKLLPPGPAAGWGERERARFMREGRLLGRLEHPAIAQVLETGLHREPSADGDREWPYLALEFVDGVALDRFAEDRGLDREERLRLLIEVCRAVHHAHQKGVVHRDLKPDNVLVAGTCAADARPVILDFGVARLVAAEGEGDSFEQEATLTRVGELVGTLSHMSPEQLSGDSSAIDTRTDVHALGVMLFQLLTGHTPFELDRQSLSEAVLRARDTEPPLPSSLTGGTRGDLDTIFAVACARDRERRYGSASELAADLERYVAREPIAARPATRTYQLRLFARRHRGLVAGLALAFALLLLGATGTAVGMVRADAKARQAQAVTRFLQQALGAASPNALGHDVTVHAMLDLYAPRIETSFADEPEVRAELHATVGWCYAQLAEWERAGEHLDAALELTTTLSGPESAEALFAARRANLVVLRADGASDANMEGTRNIMERAEVVLGADSGVALDLAADLAYGHRLRLEQDRAEELLRSVHARASRTSGASSERVLEAATALAALLNDRSRFAEAEELAGRVAQQRMARLGPDHPLTLTSRAGHAAALSGLGRQAEALAEIEDVLERLRGVYGEDHEVVVGARSTRGKLLRALGRTEEALEVAREVYSLRSEALGELHTYSLAALHDLCVLLAYARQTKEAEARVRELLDRGQRSDGNENYTMRASGLLASLLADQRRQVEALPMSELSLAEHRSTLGNTHQMTLFAIGNHGFMLWELGRHTEALPYLREAAAGWAEHHAARVAELATLRFNLARVLVEVGEFEEAEGLLLGVEELAGSTAVQRPDRRTWLEWLVRLYEDWGNPDEAVYWRDVLVAEE